MYQPNDIDKIAQEDWEDFKKEACRDELFYKGEGDLLDTAEGRAKFCKLNKSGLFRKDDPDFPNYKIWVFNNQNEGLIIKRRSHVDLALMENVEFDAEGNQIGKSYEPA